MDLETTCHVSCVTCVMSLFNLSQTVRARDLQFWHNNPHALCVMCPEVTCQVSHVRCHMSIVLCHVPHVPCHHIKCWI